MLGRGSPTAAILLSLAAAAAAQDQQLGARTKAMGGSYTAFEDDPVSIWLNPAGIATQPDQMALAYQTYTSYPLQRERAEGSDLTEFSAEAKASLVDPVFVPSYVGFVFQLGDPEAPLALGVCYARPYHLNYSFDQVDDPDQAAFRADSDMEQSFHRFRGSIAKDFRLRPPGEPGLLTHVAVGLGLDVGYESWEFSGADEEVSDSATGFGAGAGVLVGLYDDGDSLRINFGLAYQSALQWDFNIDPDIFPAFDMPQQLNVGFTFYVLPTTPLRVTVDLQWIDWSETADTAFFPGQPDFEDAVNVSMGAEYRIRVSDRVSLYPRLGFRRFDAPWDDEDDLPMVGRFKLVLDTEDEVFNMLTYGLGVSWTSEEGKIRTLEFGGDLGGDAVNLAVGFNYEF